MTKKEKESIVKMLDDAVKSYYIFRNRDDYPDKPCVRRETATRQSSAFSLADLLYHHKFITWEECCEYWSKVNIYGEEKNEECKFTSCGGNVNGICKYTTEQ